MIFTGEILRERPLIGIGIGYENYRIFTQTRAPETVVLLDIVQPGDFEDRTEGFLVGTHTAVTYWSSLSAGGGIPLLLIFYILVLGSLVFNKKTFYVGMMIFFLGISKGGVFEITLWWVIATAVTYKYLTPLLPRTDKHST